MVRRNYVTVNLTFWEGALNC